jgi:hypothetical protein
MNMAVQVLMKMFAAMDDAEKREVVLAIGEWAEANGYEAEVKAKARGKGKAKSKRPYWMKSVNGLSDEGKGVFRIEGNWVNVVSRDLEDDQLVVVGTKDPTHYYLGRRKSGERLVVEAWGKTHEIDGVVRVTSGEKFGDIEKAIEARL